MSLKISLREIWRKDSITQIINRTFTFTLTNQGSFNFYTRQLKLKHELKTHIGHPLHKKLFLEN